MDNFHFILQSCLWMHFTFVLQRQLRLAPLPIRVRTGEHAQIMKKDSLARVISYIQDLPVRKVRYCLRRKNVLKPIRSLSL